jgi:hypothetical protein
MNVSKKLFLASVSGLLLLAGANGAVAQEKNWSIALGLKAWVNNWATFTVYNSTSTGTHVTSFTSDTAASILPSVTWKYKDFFVNAGAFANTSYDFPRSSQIEDLGGALGNRTVTSQTSADRSEFDLNFGWYFHPQLAVTVGYKTIKQEYTTTESSPGVVFTPATVTSTTKYKIPTIGLSGSASLGSTRWFMYANGAFGPGISVSFSGGGEGPSGWYTASEAGVGYLFSRRFSVTAAYKTQIIHQSTKVTGGGPEQVAPDATYGFVVGGNVIF